MIVYESNKSGTREDTITNIQNIDLTLKWVERKDCEALKDVSDKGGKVLLYIQGVQMSPNSEFYKRHG